MPGVVTKKFRFHNADQFKEAFGETASTKMYAFFGRVNPFPNENSPPTPADTIQETDIESWRNIIQMKRVTSSDVTFGAPRYDWTSGTSYAMYKSNDADLFANTYYVLETDTNNVYKCLFNNNKAGSSGASTVRPSGTSTGELRTSDGYIWKYMYTLDSADTSRFLVSTHFPVSNNATVQGAAVNGAVQIVEVTAGGSSYRANTGTVASVASATKLNLETAASATDGFYTNSTIYIATGTGAGQLRDIVAYLGSTRTVTVNTGFSPSPTDSSTYVVGPKIKIRGDGNQATLAYANTVAGGAIKIIDVIATGNNYSFANVAITANGGSSATAVAHIAPESGHGSNPQRELPAYNVILSTTLSGNVSNTMVTNNDFRVIGLVNDPVVDSTGVVATTAQFDQTTKLVLTSVSGDFTSDEIIISNRNTKGRVVRFANSNATGTTGTLTIANIQPNGNGGSFIATQTITGNASSVTATISSVTAPPIRPYSGEIVYKENRVKVTRSEDQTEDIKLVVKF